ncbi:HAD-IC family P-type ATPase, partial [Cellulosimicrobium funkei]
MTAPSTRAAGLTSRDVEERVADGRVNRLPPRSGRTTWDIVRANTATRINALLGVLLVLALSTGSLINSLFGLAILANAGIGIVQELRAKRTLDALAIVGRAPVRVRRDGAVTEVDQADVVVDDVVELGAGDQVVVDGPVVESASLEVDESLLTGEADPVVKRPGDRLLSGSFVVAGSGAYRATDVGPAAYAARLAHEASAFTLVRSELRTGIDSILRVITWLLVPAGVLTVVNQLVISRQGFRQSVLGMVAALVPMVPEGLVLLTSVAFAIGVVRLGRRRCLVQELPAIEGLARVDVVCADKTGTLTENGIRLARVDVLDGPRDEVERALAALAALDPRPNASVAAVAEAFPDAPGWRATAVVPFSSATKWSGMSFVDADGPQGSWVLGAADVLLDPRSDVARRATALGADGLRVLLVASTDAPVDAATPDG